ncbi:VanZ family protein [Maribacter arenosus]|uniref:VanZ like family protein n=1 Tax=Maribacter arenosus TaxID=1854708 RepID=A0ABR7VAU5_9FLAO|nr:hypothetical protein [Maribacter arenosus]MBD0850780.1 hypothetical protein [Maribacter arenosus]
MTNGLNKKKANWVILFLLGIGIVLVFFLSWKTNPNLKGMPFIPGWLSDWADSVHNDRKRTGVPFIGLGLLVGSYLIYVQRTKPLYWLLVWSSLCLVVLIAEGVQYFLPSRSMDGKDIIWGILGSSVGLGLPFFTWHIVKSFKKKSS